MMYGAYNALASKQGITAPFLGPLIYSNLIGHPQSCDGVFSSRLVGGFLRSYTKERVTLAGMGGN